VSRGLAPREGLVESTDFQAVLDQFERTIKSPGPPPRRTGWGCWSWLKEKVWCQIWKGFPKNLEESFLEWYWLDKTLNEVGTNIDYQLALLAILTVVETSYLAYGIVQKSPDRPENVWTDVGARRELVVFALCRFACIVILSALRWKVKQTLATTGRRRGQPPASWNLSECALMAIVCIVATLVFISYDVLNVTGAVPQHECGWSPDHRFNPPAARVSHNIVKLIFYPVFMLSLWHFDLRVYHSLGLLLITVVLIFVVHRLRGMGALPLSNGASQRMTTYSLIFLAKSYFREKLLRGQYKASCAVDKMQTRTEDTLEALMPPEVVKELQLRKQQTLSHTYERMTLAQSDLVGFTKLASTRRPKEVVEFIEELFGQFDKLTDIYDVHKVETVGDAYIAGQGAPHLTPESSPLAVVQFALEMVQAVHNWSQVRGESLSCRVGVHTGPCVGGIVGTEMQRYHLFGALVTCLEVLESTSAPGRVQVSRACRESVDQEAGGGRLPVRFEVRCEEVLTTSKGEVHQYADAGGSPTFFASVAGPVHGRALTGRDQARPSAGEGRAQTAPC